MEKTRLLEYYSSKIVLGQKAIDLLSLKILCCGDPDIQDNRDEILLYIAQLKSCCCTMVVFVQK